MTEQEWRDSLKAGDEVVICRSHSVELTKVARTTKTQIIIGGSQHGQRYARNSGYRVGGSMAYFSSIQQPTGDLRERAIIATLTNTARRLKDALPTPTTREELEEFIEALRELGAK